jgi:predicted enzyme related to lactoylglutathione lyase
MANAINWFEIPATDIERATRFYSTVLGIEFVPMPTSSGSELRAFPAQEATGAIIAGEGSKPSMDGTVVYLNCENDLDGPLSRVEGAGGKILLPKTDIGQGFGFFAFIADTEGNKVGLHSNG